MAIHYDNALHMMELRGGSFIKALAELYYRADSINKSRVRNAFSDYFQQYEKHYADWCDKQNPPHQNSGEQTSVLGEHCEASK